MSLLHWNGFSTPSWQRDEVEPYSLPIILRMERGDEILHEDALLAAARGVALLLDHPDASPDGPWGEVIAAWMRGRIRKVTRRARASKWDAVCAMPGVDSAYGKANVRILLPHPVEQTPVEVSRLQVAGIDLPRNVTPSASETPFSLYVATNPNVTMSTGKMMAQVGHAAHMASLSTAPEDIGAWKDAGLGVYLAHWNDAPWDVEVRDAGFTEVAPNTLTVKGSFYR